MQELKGIEINDELKSEQVIELKDKKAI